MNRWLIAGAVAMVVLAVLLLIGGWLARRGARSFFYPSAPSMPTVVEKSTEELLAELEAVLEEKSPHVAAALQPGLADEQIAALEAAGGFQLSEELRALYRWHNGMAAGELRDFIPGHRWLPLEEAVEQQRQVREQVRSISALQRAVYDLSAGHRHGWLTVLDDGAGDGYFYDPARRQMDGSFFFHFAESGHYRYFPSLRNFLAGVIECYRRGAYHSSVNGPRIEEDYTRSEQIWSKLSAERPQ